MDSEESGNSGESVPLRCTLNLLPLFVTNKVWRNELNTPCRVLGWFGKTGTGSPNRV